MTSTVKDHSAVLVRLLCTLNGFHAKHRDWPVSVALDPDGLSALVTKHLTPLGLFRLQEKFELVEGAAGDVVASGREGASFSYSAESGHDAPALAHLWLGLDLPDEGSES